MDNTQIEIIWGETAKTRRLTKIDKETKWGPCKREMKTEKMGAKSRELENDILKK